MTLEENTQSVLIAAAGVIAKVPAVRIGVPSDQQNETQRYIVHRPVAVETHHTTEGLGAMQRRSYQVSCFWDSYSGALALADAVIAALDGVHGQAHYFYDDQLHQFEADTRVHHIAVGFEVWTSLS